MVSRPQIISLILYPIKSCAGIALNDATLTSAGLVFNHIYDREWIVVDETDEFLTQRTHPTLAQIIPAFKLGRLELHAPGMLTLHIPLDLPDPDDVITRKVRILDDLNSRLQAAGRKQLLKIGQPVTITLDF